MTGAKADLIFARYNAAIAAGDKVAALAILREYDAYTAVRGYGRPRKP